MKERQVYSESYKKPGIELNLMPKLRHLPKGMKVVEAAIMKAGIVERDGKRLEFQEIRVYLEKE